MHEWQWCQLNRTLGGEGQQDAGTCWGHSSACVAMHTHAALVLHAGDDGRPAHPHAASV